MNFSDIFSSIERTGDTLSVPIHKDWSQGRSAFGGLVAGLGYHATREITGEKRALRSAMINFVGPTGPKVDIDVTKLRSGRTSSSYRTELTNQGDTATEIVFTFADYREDSVLDFPPPKSPVSTNPLNDKSIESFHPPFPAFYSQFEVAPIHNMPFAQAKDPDIYWWVRHNDNDAKTSMTGLLTLADAMIPGYGTVLKEWSPMSSVNWMINLLTDTPKTEEGWWLMRTTADSAGGGFSSQNMAIWNTSGECILLGRQVVSIFA
ncbi:thioesterase family protein [Hirschia maritima]|uniref:thioesterase family protein n=1 Tax=Hirschia maritima TaxID=1121961 RepID=UPI000365CDFB|nr:thioesterase family protein [Hirschia maritima]